jgi:hypothetical protein
MEEIGAETKKPVLAKITSSLLAMQTRNLVRRDFHKKDLGLFDTRHAEVRLP